MCYHAHGFVLCDNGICSRSFADHEGGVHVNSGVTFLFFMNSLKSGFKKHKTGRNKLKEIIA